MSRNSFNFRREGNAFDFVHERVPYHAVINRLDNGEVGEVFLDAGKIGSTSHTIGKESAVLFSIARRYGAPMAVIRGALPMLEDSSPAGPMGMALAIAEGNP